MRAILLLLAGVNIFWTSITIFSQKEESIQMLVIEPEINGQILIFEISKLDFYRYVLYLYIIYILEPLSNILVTTHTSEIFRYCTKFISVP